MSDKKRIILVAGMFLAASLVAFVVLNRWLVTDIGLLSYGRIWQLYASYSDFGFVRRVFVGTILTESGINSLFQNEYHFAFAIHHIAISVLSSLIAYYCISRKITDPIFLASIAFSPALIIHLGYNTGSLDVFVVIFAATNILFVRNSAIFSIVIVCGLLTHELFVFTIPAQFLVMLMHYDHARSPNSLIILIAPVAAFSITAIAVFFFGTVDMPREIVEQIVRQKIPNAAGQHNFWSGYFEIASTAEQNSTISLQNLTTELKTDFFWLIVPLTYVTLLIARLWTYSDRLLESVAISTAVVAPLLAVLVATDYHRWIAMSANIGILFTLVYAAKTGRSSSRWNTPLLVMCLLAPFGTAAIDRPFPMHQFVIEKFIN
ncbi:hypothetical protein OS189_17855 [Sulfitobacter sp. F26169L]|uniref:hypothetical protein n=1 Tax=Sulfitobacter sp. F26169L TaxID=2996015 RepID=UPI002260E858|nr:hypothetical protein [Sulfitobacter sp. F26169L]MCX7568210.1 hypothetical protein [Sulfitobacter sp. F26169L]